MLQRNPGPYPLTLPTLDPPKEVQEGDVIDHPTLLAGFVPIDEPVEPGEPRVAPPRCELPGPVNQAQGDGQEPAKKKTSSRGGRRGDDAPEATQ